jgi:hypothetical protein
MPLSLDVTVVRARSPAANRVLLLPSLPPQGACADWLETSARLLRRQNAPRLMGEIAITIRLEDSHPRASAAGAIAPVLALLIRCGVLQSDRAQAVRRVTAEWAPVAGVEIHLRRAP